MLWPPSSSNEPFFWYPSETIGGILQQPALWPWVAGMVDILANRAGWRKLLRDLAARS